MNVCNHNYFKFFRWRVVIHGCIDGYSRRILYLKAADNNKSEYVLEYFVGVHRLGIPSRVRGERTSENVRVAEFMVEHMGLGRGSFKAGRSVHNQ
jgi:hypothetical protein